MENSDRNEQVLIKKCLANSENVMSRCQNILALAPIGLKSLRAVEDTQVVPLEYEQKRDNNGSYSYVYETDASGNRAKKVKNPEERFDVSFEKGDVITARRDDLGDKESDGAVTKLEKGVKRATRNRDIAAAEAYQIEVETSQLMKAAEDILTFNRALKEAWLFGKLDTLGQTTAEKEAEAHAEVVAEILPKVVYSLNAERNGHT